MISESLCLKLLRTPTSRKLSRTIGLVLRWSISDELLDCEDSSSLGLGGSGLGGSCLGGSGWGGFAGAYCINSGFALEIQSVSWWLHSYRRRLGRGSGTKREHICPELSLNVTRWCIITDNVNIPRSCYCSTYTQLFWGFPYYLCEMTLTWIRTRLLHFYS